MAVKSLVINTDLKTSLGNVPKLWLKEKYL